MNPVGCAIDVDFACTMGDFRAILKDVPEFAGQSAACDTYGIVDDFACTLTAGPVV